MILLYLDPGSGSILLQLLIAGASGIAILIGSQWRKIKRFFSKKKDEPEIELEDDDDKEE